MHRAADDAQRHAAHDGAGAAQHGRRPDQDRKRRGGHQRLVGGVQRRPQRGVVKLAGRLHGAQQAGAAPRDDGDGHGDQSPGAGRGQVVRRQGRRLNGHGNGRTEEGSVGGHDGGQGSSSLRDAIVHPHNGTDDAVGEIEGDRLRRGEDAVLRLQGDLVVGGGLEGELAGGVLRLDARRDEHLFRSRRRRSLLMVVHWG